MGAVPSVTTPYTVAAAAPAGGRDKSTLASCKPSMVKFWLYCRDRRSCLISGMKRNLQEEKVPSAALLGRGTANQKTDTAGDKVPELGDRGSQRTGLCQRFVIHPHVPQKDQRHQTEKPDTGGNQNLRSAAASRLLREHGIALKLDLSGICLCAGDKTDLVYRAGGAAYGGFRPVLSYAPGRPAVPAGFLRPGRQSWR